MATDRSTTAVVDPPIIENLSPDLAESSTEDSSPLPTSPTTRIPTLPVLPPLVTNTNSVRRPNMTSRPPSYANKRMSSYQSRASSSSRPSSHVFPLFHSSLPYTLVRDFAYPTNHPYHYGPPPNNSGLSTPVSETRRLSDPAASSWDDAREPWPATPPWTTENAGPSQSNSREQLPAMTFADPRQPCSEDEDLQSPVSAALKHKNYSALVHDSGGSLGDVNGGDGENYHVSREDQGLSDADGPRGEIVSYPRGYAGNSLLSPEVLKLGQRRDSHFATSLRRPSEEEAAERGRLESDDDYSEADDDMRSSENYSFAVGSPDEEMHGKAVALFDFESEHENELPLTEGQIVLVSYRHGAGWLVAQDPATGENGLVPEEFVRLVRDIEGGLNGLTAQMDELLSPDTENAATPIASAGNLPIDKMNGSNGSGTEPDEKHQSMHSAFSSSGKDRNHSLQDEIDDDSTPTLSSHPLKDGLADKQTDKKASM